jgi:hypothetical protein
MYGHPGACKYSYDTAPNDVPNGATGLKIVARRWCAFLDGWDGKRKDFVQEVESGEND